MNILQAIYDKTIPNIVPNREQSTNAVLEISAREISQNIDK